SDDGSITGSGVGFGWSSGGTPRPESSYTDSPSSNSTPLTTATLVAPSIAQRHQNTRNSFIDVAQVYAHRQSLAYPVDPAIAMQQRMSMIMMDNSQYEPDSHGGNPAVRPSRKSSAIHQQSILTDRRSVAGWPTGPGGAEDGKGGTNTWHRKRASVVIPEGTIPVRLWKEDAAAMATAAGTTAEDASSLRTPLASGTIPRIGAVSEKREGESTGTGAGAGTGAGEAGGMGYRPSVRNGAAVFEGSMPRKMTTSRSPSRSRLDDENFDAQQHTIDSLGISDAPATATLQQQQTSMSRRKWATGQIAVDDYNIQTSGLQDRGDGGEDAEHVIVSLPSPRGCLLEDDEHNYNHRPMGDDQDRYEYGMRSLPIVLTHRTTASTGGGSFKDTSSSGKGNGGSGGGGGGGRRSAELANTATSGTAGGATKFSYLDDYREQQQQQKLQQQQQQQQE
ncbi:hypothetical protein BGZ95_003042, partial [Linnemannia exigua]